MHFHLDYETVSTLSIKDVGLDNYARDAKVLCVAHAVDEQEPVLRNPILGDTVEELKACLRDRDTAKIAWNALFERAISRYALGIEPAGVWVDPAAISRYAGAGSSMQMTGEVLRLQGDAAKDKDGKRLMSMFSFQGKRGWRTPQAEPEEFSKYGEYCRQDVRAEREIWKRLKPGFSLPEREQAILALDWKINERGIPVDMVFVQNATKIAAAERERLMTRLLELTGLENPNSVQQLSGWLKERGYCYGSLGAKWVKLALELRKMDGPNILPEAAEALEIRQALSKTSTKKLEAIALRVSPDGRLRQNYRYYGAHTGRWSGEGVQLQNLPRGTVENVAAASECIRTSVDAEKCRAFGKPLDVVSSCLRSAFRAPDGMRFVICDLSTIEVRVLAWLSGCESLLEIFKRGGDPYIAFAAKHLYKIAESEVTKRQRQIAKSAVLGCGFQLSGGAEEYDQNDDLVKTGLWGYAANMGVEMSKEEAHAAVAAFREAYRPIVRLWYNLQDAAIAAVAERKTIELGPVKLIGCKSLLAIELPAGRRLHYLRPEVRQSGTGRNYLSYEAVNSITKKWGRRPTYGGHLTENLVQAIARDVLAEGMLRADRGGIEIVGHTHDEIIALANSCVAKQTYEVLHDLMTRPMPWAPDLPLAADGDETQVYKK